MPTPRLFRPVNGPPWLAEYTRILEEYLRKLGRSGPTNSYTADAALGLTDGSAFVDATAGDVTITLPTAASALGKIYTIKKIDASGNDVIIDANGAETIDGAANITFSTQWDSYTVQSNGVTWFVI